MVPDAGSGLRREKVAAGGLEEFQHRPVFKRGRIGEVDHHLRAGNGLLEPLAGDAVDAAFGRGGDDLMATLAQNGDGLRADQAGAADDDDLHGFPPLSMAGDLRMEVGNYIPASTPPIVQTRVGANPWGGLHKAGRLTQADRSQNGS